MSPWKIEGQGLSDPIIGYEGQIARMMTTLGEITIRGTQEGFELIGDQEGDVQHGFGGTEYTDQPGSKGRTIQLPDGQWLTAIGLAESTL